MSILENINNISDVKSLSLNDKNQLASEIRNLIIETVFKNGGHLASNLGIVDLIVALASVFDFNNDAIMFDVGHQCYAYKILTDRLNKFSTIRKNGGISGFPNSNESKYDLINSGHASNSISISSGYSFAVNNKETVKNVVTIIGDGALTGGLSYEGLNNLKLFDQRQIIVINDNNMSISKSVGSSTDHLVKLRTSSFYRLLKRKTKSLLQKMHYDFNRDENLKGKQSSIKAFKNAIKYYFQKGLPFVQYNATYYGPIDGHNIKKMIKIFNEILSVEKGNIILHVVTKKGKGWKDAEDYPVEYHGYSPNKTNEETFSSHLGFKLNDILSNNENVYAITAAMSYGTGLNLVLPKYRQHVIDVGIAEAHAVSLAAGMAKGGLIPIVCIYSTFIQRAIDQIIHDVSLNNLPVIFCLDRAGVVPDDGLTHQGIYDIGLFNSMPNMTIMDAINFKEQDLLIDFALTYNNPIAIRYSKSTNLCADINVENIEYGKWQYIKKNDDSQAVIITYGAIMMNEVLKAYNILIDLQIKVDVINARFIKPIDFDLINSLDGKKVYIFEDMLEVSSLASIISLYIQQKNLNISMKAVGIKNPYIPAMKVSEILESQGIDSSSIVNIIKNEINLN